jgi:hypothetical protein
MIGKNLIAAAGNGISTVAVAEAIDFDGTNDYLRRTSDLAGNTASRTFTFSAWIWQASTATGWIYVNSNGTNNRFTVRVVTGTLEIVGTANTNSEILRVTAPLAAVSRTATFYHVLISMDMANAANRSIYINDIAQSLTVTTYTNALIPFNQVDHVIAGTQGGSAGDLGRLSNVFLDYTYRDLSNVTNRRLFVTADLKPADGQAALNPILYLPLNDPTAPGANAGTGGNFTLTGTVARSGRGPNQYNAPYSDLDGTADYLSRASDPTGLVDGNAFTLSFNVNFDTVSAPQAIVSVAGGYFVIQLTSSNVLSIVGYTSALAVVISATVSSAFVIGRNYQVVMSFDMSSTSKRHICINGQSSTVTYSTYNNANIDWTRNSFRIGGPDYVNGRLGAVWFNTSYIDLSVADNLAKFVTGTGIDAKPVDPGATGELPTGTSPIIYLPMYGNNAGKNYGTGGDFTVNSGPYTGARGPNEYWASAVGNSGFLSRDTPLSGVTDTKTLTFFALFKPTSINATRSFWFLGGVASSSFRGQIQVVAGNGFRITFRNASDVTVLNATVTSPLIDSTSTTYSIHCCVDLADSAKRAIYINGVLATVTWSTYTNDNMNFSAQRSGIGAEWGSSWSGSLLRGNLGSLYIANSFVDFRQESNRLLFADAFNFSTDIGAAITDGTIPNPMIFMKFDPANNGANFGTGGNYTNSSMSDGGQL